MDLCYYRSLEYTLSFCNFLFLNSILSENDSIDDFDIKYMMEWVM